MDYSELAYGFDYNKKQAEAGRNLTPEQRAAAAASLGIDLTTITRGIINPNVGFTDPRTSAQLASSPAFPAKKEENKDGSGVNIINQPAQRNPQITGFPSVSPLAINDAKLAPSQVIEKLKSLITDISGPKAGNINVDIAGGAAGPATLLNGGDLTNKLTSLLPNVESLSGSIVHLSGAFGATSAQFNSALDSLVSLPSKLTGGTITSLNPSSLTSQVTSRVSSALNKITPAQLAQADADFAKAQATITESFSKASSSASNMQAKAQESLTNKLNLDKLRSDAGDIADRIFEKLKGFTPTNITTKIPVVGISEMKIPAGVIGISTLSDPVPNPLPATIPLYKVESSQQKSIENCIALFEEYTSQRLYEINQALYATKTKKEYLAAKARLDTGNAKTAAFIEQLVSSAGDDGPELRTTLLAIKKDYAAKISVGLVEHYNSLPEG